jgi:LPS-assembly protein
MAEMDPARATTRTAFRATLLAGSMLAAAVSPARAAAPPAAHMAPISKTAPVTFTADQVQYDRQKGIVTATGHVEAWQNGHTLRADKVTFDRITNVMAASGHVELIEPTGEVAFSDYAELTSSMRDGVERDLRALMAANGKLAANGARRIGGQLNELSRAVYSTCNLCKKHPNRAPLWEIRARSAVQDVVHKRIEYQDAWIDIYGLPVLYLPYFSNADPSVKRQSGILVPSIGSSTELGVFAQVPYYWVLDPSSDATIIPLIGTKKVAQVDTIYRKRFNFGTVRADGSIAYDEGHAEGHLFSEGRFDYDDTWRYGFDINVASSQDYLRDFRIGNPIGNVLNTGAYAEGFGEGAYAKVSAASYQGLNSTVTNSQLPFVLPRYQYDYFGLTDSWGGRLSFDSNDFNVVRRIGANDQRINLNAQWERPGIGAWGDVWSVTARVESEAYNAYDINQQPDYAPVNNTTTARAQPTVAVKLAWPLLRSERSGASELIEPIVQLIAAPNTGSSTYREVPNEDSLSPEFTDTELFSLNRFQGVDRQEGGLRANIGLHGTWTTKAGVFDGLVGQSYRLHPDDTFASYVGLGRRVSDVVGRITYTPSPWFDLTTRARVDHHTLDLHYAEAVGSFGPQFLRVSAGYLYTQNTPYFLDYQPAQGDPNEPRNEADVSVATHYGQWRASGYARRDLEHSQMVSTGGNGAYENECFIFEAKYIHRYTSINNDHGDSTVLFQITLKTVGEFGFHAL